MEQEVTMTTDEMRSLAALRVGQFRRRLAYQRALAKLENETKLQARDRGLLKRFASTVASFLSRGLYRGKGNRKMEAGR